MCRILLIADIHGHEAWQNWVLRQASDFSHVVIAGDSINAFSSVPWREQVRRASAFLAAILVNTILVSGNHDFVPKDPRVSVDTHADGGWVRHLHGHGHVVAVDGDTVDIDRHKVAACGWLDPRWPAGADIVVYHAPPAATLISGSDGNDIGDMEAMERLRHMASPPRLFLCGHLHEPAKFWERPAYAPGCLVLLPGVAANDNTRVPNHWIIDMETTRATHSSGESIGL